MNILITGVSGFIGSRLAEMYVDKGEKIIGIDIVDCPDILLNKIEFFKIDLLVDDISHLVKKSQLVINLVSLNDLEKCENDPYGAFLSNAQTVKILMECIIKNGSPALLHGGTWAIYGSMENYRNGGKISPHNEHAISKLFGEKYAIEIGKRFNIKRSIIRIPLIHNDDELNRVCSQIINVGETLVKQNYKPEKFINIDRIQK